MTRLISGKNRWITSATAVVLLVAVAASGTLLADAAADLGKEIQRSEIITALTGGKRTDKAAAVMAILEPGKASTFFSYLNAMAPAVVNLEVLPEEQLDSFDALYSAAKENQVTLESFLIDEEGNGVQVDCASQDRMGAERFLETLQSRNVFSQVVRSVHTAENQDKFTINCEFKKDYYKETTKIR